MNDTSIAALQRAIDHFGGAAPMAQKAGISKAAIYFWLAGRPVSPSFAVKIEQATGGAVTRAELRPDLFGELTG